MTEKGIKISEGARRNRELRRQMDERRREERRIIKEGLLMALQNPDATPEEKIRAAELYREYKFALE